MSTCKECGTKLKGRSDKKFCDSNCRNAYHNEKSRPGEQHIRKINRQLSKNRNLLDRLLSEGVERAPQVLMKSMGFKEELFTSLVIDQDQEIYFVYDQAFRKEGQEIVILVAEIESYRQTG